MGYPAPLAAALSGASLRQLAYWRRQGHPLLMPEYGRRPRVLYSYRDVVALRMFVKLRGETSLQRLRRAVSWLESQHPDTHLSTHRLRAAPGGRTIVWISDEGDYFDVVEHPGQGGVRVVMEALFQPFTTKSGRRVPSLGEPAARVVVDPAVRGGFPVIEGTRIPFDIIAGLRADGLTAEEIADLYPPVTDEAVSGASHLAELVSEVTSPSHAA